MSASTPNNTSARILVVDDDPIVAESLAEFLQEEGHDAATAFNGAEALDALAKADRGETANQAARPYSVVVADVSMPVIDGMQLLERITKEHPGTSVLMLTGYGTIENAVRAVRLGASDYLTKPVVDNELRIALERALRQHALAAENRALRKQLDTRFNLDNIVGSDARMLKIYDLIEAVAPTKTTVLMTGESGVGKSLIAHAIHHHSPRKAKPYVELACGSIPETLLESELFGHVKGSFTGAHTDKVGKFLAADGGTLFLDEINSASPGMQLKLLRVLQERRFEPVGSNQTIEVDVRVVLASNQPLEDLVAKGQFRQDLYYRINVVKIELPSLRERVSDIPLLADHFVKLHAAGVGKAIAGIAPDALDALRRYHYPGNVRELANIIERACVLTRTPTIKLEDLPPNVVSPMAASPNVAGSVGSFASGSTVPPTGSMPIGTTGVAPTDLEAALREPEKQIILGALKTTGWNRLKAAELLNINRTTLYKKMKLLGIDPSRDAA
ncbi:MAG: sigma-54-dependent transcriptional regulator [Phycisphaerales bacterium]